jgi:NADPH2:quinone reductase
MTAVGGPEVLQPAEVAELEFGRRDVRVELRAAGVNPVDAKLRGRGTIAGARPAVLGRDGAGVVSDVGAEVTRFRPGDEVYFCDGGFGTTQGTYAEAKALDERLVAHKPSRPPPGPSRPRPGRRRALGSRRRTPGWGRRRGRGPTRPCRTRAAG